MESKIFLINEHAETIFDVEKIDDWKALISELGMTEQEKLINGDAKVSPIPFPVMTEAENTIYTVVLDSHIDYKKFGGEAVPLQVLSIIALCEKEKYFDNIEIWFSRRNPDPMVVGRKYEDDNARINEYSWRMINYKVAQWGAKFEPMSKLLPAWEEYKRAEIEEQHSNALRSFEQQLERFKFQVSAYKA